MMLKRAFQQGQNTLSFSSKLKPNSGRNDTDFLEQSEKLKESSSQTSSMRAILIDT